MSIRIYGYFFTFEMGEGLLYIDWAKWLQKWVWKWTDMSAKLEKKEKYEASAMEEKIICF